MADTRPSPSIPKLRFPDWQEPFEAALREDDVQKLPQLVEEAEGAIFLRSQSLVSTSGSHAERDAIADAMRKLRAIETGKLHYPDWNGQ